ncbi:glycosyl transferase group 1 [Haloterrigena salina JCM 13891]|uniref:Glycosyl transferase group 1 n=2 Tax=Haloterrigena salina TaxID=504937 RepID=M0BUL9_9EURY|nr:glycosyl transferase group 1 [Haloterrigena salina JCM 13891]
MAQDHNRILILSGQLGAAGTPQVLLNITKHLRKETDIEIAYLGGKSELVPEFQDLGVPVHRLGETPISIESLLSLRRLLKDRKYDLLHTHMMAGGLIGRIIGRIVGIPVVSTIHTSYPNRPYRAKIPDLATSPLAEMNICVSNAVEQSLPRTYKLGSRTKVVHNCIDVDQIRQEGMKEWDSLDWTTNVEKDAPLIANVARYDPKKRRKDLIKSLPLILEEHPSATIIFTGDGQGKEELQMLARKYDVHDNIACVGFVENPQSVYHHADLVALPSISEGFSISMLEAMAHGKPIVATSIPPFQEALGEDHPFVEPCSPQELGEKIRQVLSDESFAEELGEKAFARVQKNFSGESAAIKYRRIYQSVLDTANNE